MTNHVNLRCAYCQRLGGMQPFQPFWSRTRKWLVVLLLACLFPFLLDACGVWIFWLGEPDHANPNLERQMAACEKAGGIPILVDGGTHFYDCKEMKR